MKRKNVLKSLDDLSLQLVEAEPNRPAQDSPESSPVDTKAQRESQLHVTVLEHSGFARYRHWGLNE